MVKHHAEVDGKSTAVHAAIIAPTSVTIHTYPDIPDYDPEQTVLVFPGEDSHTLGNLIQSSRLKGPSLFSTVVFVDSTWNQCYGICQDPR